METVIRFFSSIVVAQYIRDTVDDLNVNLNLEKLVEPGIEEWLLFLEDILKLYNKKGEKLLINELYSFYFSSFSSIDAPLKAYKAVCEDDFFLFKGNILKEDLTPSEFFAIMPDFIDAVESHGEDLSINQIKDLLLLFIPVVDNIISNLKFLIAYKLFYVKKAAYEKGKVRHEIIDCVGALSLEETEYYSENYFAQEKVYMSSTVDKNFPVLNLSPFFIVKEYPKGFGNQIFFYWRVTGDGSLEYSNYQGEVKFNSQDYAKDLIKSFRKFTSEKKVNLVIKLLDWQKEKRKKEIKKGIRQIPQRGTLQEKNEQKKVQEEVKKAGETKKYARNSYRYALEACWSDGLLGEDERVYLDELKRVLELSASDVKVIEDSTRVKFAEKIDRIKPVSKDKNELSESLDFLEEEHQLLLKNLEERRQQIRTLERKNKSLEQERELLKEGSEKLETEIVEKDKENVKLKKSFKELKVKVDSMSRLTDLEKSGEIEILNKKIIDLENFKELSDKKNQKLAEELASFRNKNSLLEEQLEELEEKLKETHSSSVSYMEQLGNLETDKSEEIEHLRKELKEVQKKNNSLARLAQELTKKNEENKKLLQKLDEFDVISQKLAHVQELNKEKEKKILELEERSEELIKHKKDFEDINEEKENEIVEIKKQLKNLMKSKNDLEKNFATASKNKDALVKLVQDLKTRVDESKKFVEKAREADTLKSRMEEIEEHNREVLNIKEKELDTLKSRMEEIEKHNRELLNIKEKGENEYINLNQEFESLTEELDNYKARLADMEEHNRELIVLKETRDREYLDLIHELDRVSSESLSMRKDFHANKEEGETLINLVNELREKLVHSDKETGDLQSRFEWLEKEKKELLDSNDKQSQKIRQLVSLLNELREEKKILQTNVVEINKEKISMEDRLERILKEFSNAKQFLNQAKVRLSDYENLQNELNSLKGEHELYLSERETNAYVSEKLTASLLQIEQLELKLSEVEKEKEEIQLMRDTLERQFRETEDKMVQSKSGAEDRDKLVQRLRDIDREKQELIRNNEKQKNTIIDLIKKTNSINEENKKMTISFQSLEMEKEELIRLNQELQEKGTMSESNMASFDTELLEIKSRNNTLMEHLEQSSDRIKELEAQINDLFALQEKLKNLQEEKETYENELARALDELEKSRNTVRELTDKMALSDGITEKETLLSQAQHEEMETLRKDFLTRNEEIKSMEQEKNTYQKEKSKLLLLLKGLKSKLSEKDKQLEEMQSRAMAVSVTDDIKQKFEALEKEKEAFEDLKREKDRIICELETELQKLKGLLQKQEIDDNVKQKFEALEKEKEAFEDLKREKDRIICELEAELQKLKVSLQEKEIDDNVKQKFEDLEKEKEAFEDLKREKDRVICELEAELHKLNTLLQEKDKDDRKQKLEGEKEKEAFEDLKREKDRVINDLEAELQKLKASLQEMEIEIKGKEEMEILSLEKQKIEEAWDEIKRSEENNMTELETEWEKLSQNREEVEAERVNLAKERELLKAIDIETLEAEKRELESAWIELAEERENLKSLVSQLEKEENSAENNLLDTIRNKDQQIAILKEELECSLIELEEQRKFIQIEREKLSEQFGNMQLTELQSQIELEWKKLEGDRIKFDSDLNDMEEEKKLLEEEYRELSRKKAELEDREISLMENEPLTERSTLVLSRDDVEKFLSENMPEDAAAPSNPIPSLPSSQEEESSETLYNLKKKGLFARLKKAVRFDRIPSEEDSDVEMSEQSVNPIKEDLSVDFFTSDWPMFMGGLTHNGFNDEETELLPPLKIKWKFATKGSIIASPSIYKGISYFGSLDGKLYAVNIEKGEKLWEFKTGTAIASTPAVAGDWLFFTCGEYVYALDRHNGNLIWKFRTGSLITSSPAVAYGNIYFGSTDGKFYALSVKSGQKIWEYITKGSVDYSPAVCEDIVYGCSKNEKIFAIDAKRGEKIWDYDVGCPFKSSPVIYQDAVLLACENNSLYSWNSKQGTIMWEFKALSSLFASPAIGEGLVYLSVGGKTLYTIDMLKGNRIREYDIDSISYSSPAYANGTLYVGAGDGKLYSIELDSSKNFLQKEGLNITHYVVSLEGEIVSPPAISSGYILAGTKKGFLYGCSSDVEEEGSEQ
jgi:outer membrane protein assembly factor BamB/chromosome segregation ATPase